MSMLENEVFISYAWGGESEQIADKIDTALQQRGIKLIRDKRNLGFKGSIKEFMERIGRGNCVIVVISDKYLRSENCMFELMEIAENQNFHDRIFPIVLQDADIYKGVNRIKYIKHWEDQISELDLAMKTVNAANLHGITDEINLYTRIRATIAELANTLKDMNTLTPEIHESSNFSQLIEAIEERVKTPLEASKPKMTTNTTAFSSLSGKPKKAVKIPVPQPSDQFISFHIGNIEIPSMIVFGTPETPFLPSDVNLVFRPEFIEDHPKYPLELKAVQDFLIEVAKEEDNIKELKAMDPMPRIDSIEQGPEKSGDSRGELTIRLSKTRYGSLFTTHRSLDYSVIPNPDTASHKTIREAYCHPPFEDLSNSFLANCPGVDVALISRSSNQYPQNQLIIRKRSQNVVAYRGWYQVSATGFMSLAHRDHTGIPSPFITAITEAKQEIADGLVLRPEDFKLVGLALKWEDLHPGFFGYIETNKSVSELIGDFKRDSYEGYLSGIFFDPDTVLSHIAKEKWHAISALSAIAALLAFFPREKVEASAKKVSLKGFKDFIEKT